MSALSRLNIHDLRPRLSVKPNPAGYPLSRRPRTGPVKGVVIHYNGPALPFRPNPQAELDFVVRVDTPNHQQRIGMDSLAYHFVVLSDGAIWQSRALEYIAWHAGNFEANEHYLAIHLPLGGDQDATPEQWAAVEALIAALRADYGFGRDRVTGHQEWSATACPGRLMACVLAYRAGRDPQPEGLTAVADPRISKAAFARVLVQAASPAATIAAELYDLCVGEGVDPAVALAFFGHESSYGTAGITKVYDTKNWGNVRTPEDARLGQPISIPGRGSFVKYPTWQNGLLDWCHRLKGPKYAGSGLLTVESILPKYAPGSDGNSPARYAQAVRAAVEDWSSTYKVRVTASVLNVRQGPATSYAVAGQCKLGEVVECDGTKNEGQGDWHHLHSGLGFISGAWVEKVS